MERFLRFLLCLYLSQAAIVAGEYQSAGCSDEGCGIPCYLRPAEDECHYTEPDPCDGGGATELDQQLWLLNNSLVRLQEKLIQKGIIPAGNTCPPLPLIDHGGVIYSDLLLSVGVEANFVCNEGYSLHGHGQFECSVDGVWIGSDSQEIKNKPSCEDSLVICEPLVAVPYGHISYHIVDTTRVQPGDVASYSCDDLYTLHGTEHRICLRNGTWSGMEPECIAPATEPSRASTKEIKSSVAIPVGTAFGVIGAVLIAVLAIALLLCVRKRRAKPQGYDELLDNRNIAETDGQTETKSKKKLDLALNEETVQARESGVATIRPEEK